jgi:hypothetical protein
MDALLFVSSSVAYTGTPSCWQYLFMLLRRRLLAFALVGPVETFVSGVPKPKKPTDSGGGGGGSETLTVVPLPLLLRTWTVPPSDLTV